MKGKLFLVVWAVVMILCFSFVAVKANATTDVSCAVIQVAESAVSYPVSINVTKLPDKIYYMEDDPFDPTGLEVTVTYSDGSINIICIVEEHDWKGLSFRSTDFGTVGDMPVTVTYCGLSATFTLIMPEATGTCGDGLTWMEETNGTLTIFGTGMMDDFIDGNVILPPWSNSITSVRICEGVTNIGSYAFSGCDSLASAVIPKTVTNIGDFAFNGCDNLKVITLPKEVVCIGEGAFVGSGLTSVSIPDNVISIEKDAFSFC